MSQNYGDIIVFIGNSNDFLVELIYENLGIGGGDCEVRQFSDGEISINVGGTVRGKDVFIIQSTSSPVNSNLMELLILMDALKRASTGRINTVTPYYGYARQDRKTKTKELITSGLITDPIAVARADRIICMNLHAGQIQGYFDIPVDHLSTAPYLAGYFKDMVKKGDSTVASLGLGGVARTCSFSNRLNLPIAIIEKRRPRPNISEVMNIIGGIERKNCALVGDIIGTAGTICQTARALRDWGAKKVYGCATHGVLSGPALDRLENFALEKSVTTDTIELPGEKRGHSIDVASVAGVFADAVSRINASISAGAMSD